MMLDVHITVDVEVWPLGAHNWPHTPLQSTADCRRELAAYFWGECAEGSYGLPYQLDVLERYGLRATFFVDPMFSFALGIEALRQVVGIVQSRGQRVELHLHPEWLTDPRCEGLPVFSGPLIGTYTEGVQEELLRMARDRLLEAGAKPVTAFRAGSWGATLATLHAVSRIGIGTDASLNATYPASLPDLPLRDQLQRPCLIHGITEMPMTRFDDGMTAGGRPLSMVGSSFEESRHVLERLHAAGAATAVIVLHSNEFVKTEKLIAGRPLEPRRLIARRFERLCQYLANHGGRFPTKYIGDHATAVAPKAATGPLVRGSRSRTLVRVVEQVLSRWY